MKTRRVGSLTCGALLIIFGVLFMVHMFVPALKYEFIIKFWPVILIALGVEMLLSCRNKEEGIKLKYDGATIFLTILLGFFCDGNGSAAVLCGEFSGVHLKNIPTGKMYQTCGYLNIL